MYISYIFVSWVCYSIICALQAPRVSWVESWRCKSSQHRKIVPLSPYVEKPFNSKVIKSFVPDLSSRKCFSCFGIPMLSICALWTLWTFCEPVWMCLFHIFMYGYVTQLTRSTQRPYSLSPADYYRIVLNKHLCSELRQFPAFVNFSHWGSQQGVTTTIDAAI